MIFNYYTSRFTWLFFEREGNNGKRYASGHGDTDLLAHAYSAVGVSYVNMSDYQSALVALDTSLELYGGLQAESGGYTGHNTAILLSHIATCYLNLGVEDKFITTHRKATDDAETLGDVQAQILCLRNDATYCNRKGDFGASLVSLRKALMLADDTGNRYFCAAICSDLAYIYRLMGDIEEAESLYMSALNYCNDTGSQVHMGVAYGNIGMIHHERGRLLEAENYYVRAIEMSDNANKVLYYVAYGKLWYDRGLTNECIKMHEIAIRVASELPNNAQGKYNAMNSLGPIYIETQDYAKAKATLLAALELAERMNNDIYIAQSSRWMALVLWCLREDLESVEYAQKAYDIYRGIFGDNHGRTVAARETLVKVRAQ